jgi:predicted amino acid dehydrogenase
LGCIAPEAIICDAGYPKNLSPRGDMRDARVFFGGLGQIAGGLSFVPDFKGVLNRHPFPDVAHGCLLEGMALALARRFEPFSQGRGFITRERVEEIETIAALHGIHLAPFFNAEGPLERMHTSETARRWGVSGTDSQTEVHPVLKERSIR